MYPDSGIFFDAKMIPIMFPIGVAHAKMIPIIGVAQLMFPIGVAHAFNPENKMLYELKNVGIVVLLGHSKFDATANGAILHIAKCDDRNLDINVREGFVHNEVNEDFYIYSYPAPNGETKTFATLQFEGKLHNMHKEKTPEELRKERFGNH